MRKADVAWVFAEQAPVHRRDNLVEIRTPSVYRERADFPGLLGSNNPQTVIARQGPRESRL
jgi:hypothetical protein